MTRKIKVMEPTEKLAWNAAKRKLKPGEKIMLCHRLMPTWEFFIEKEKRRKGKVLGFHRLDNT